MRVSLVALCSLTVYALQDGSNSALASPLSEPEATGNETATLPTMDSRPEEVLSLVPPEHSEEFLFSSAAEPLMPLMESPTTHRSETDINAINGPEQGAIVTESTAPELAATETIALEPIASEPTRIEATVANTSSAQEIAGAIAIHTAPSCPRGNRAITRLGHALSTSIASGLETGSPERVRVRLPRQAADDCVDRPANELANNEAVGNDSSNRASDSSTNGAIAQHLAAPQPFVESSSGLMVAERSLGDAIRDTADQTAEQLGLGDTAASPLERPPTRLFNLETANHLQAGALQLSAGVHQTPPDDYPATGNQIYHGELIWGIRDDLQLAITGQVFDDPPGEAIDGEFPNVRLISLATSAKYRILEEENFALGVLGSIELLSLSSSLFDTDDSDERVVGALQFPFTYNASPDVQLHLTPGFSFLPGSFSDADFYGTTFNLGTGLSWRPSDRWMLFSTLTIPIGPGDNSIDSDDGSTDRRLVWSVGTRYNVTPKVGLDLFATNGFGVTPATSGLTFIPDGDDALIGVRLHYTPDARSTYRQSFRQTPDVPLSERDRQLLVDGFTLTTANTLQPGSVALSGGVGSNGNYNVGVAYSPDRDFQIEAFLEEFGSEDEVGTDVSAGDDLKYLLGARVRLLDQVQGDPVSLAARLLGGRDTDSDNQVGTLFIDVPLTYQVNSRTALTFNPRLSAFADEFQFGVGFGVNYEVIRGLQLIGEVTPLVNGEPTVWAAGTRYRIPETSVSLDVYATNAIGRNGLGTLAGDLGGARFGFNVNWILGDR
ncbi:MAG: hypothetical protein AAFR31_11565 [Cyanobacteria bacterium J06627_8]